MKKVLLWLLCFFSFQNLCAQTSYAPIDSLLEKALFYNQKNQDSAVFYSEKAYTIAKKRGLPSEIATTGYLYSFYLIAGNQFSAAEAIISANMASEEKISFTTMGNLFYNRGTIAYLKEEYDVAIENYMIAANYFEESNQHRNMSRSYLQLSVLYEKTGHLELADYFGNLSLGYIKGSENHRIDSEEKNLVEALEGYLENTPVDDKLRSVLHYNLAKLYVKQEEFKKGVFHFQKSIKIKEEKGYKNLLVETKVRLAEAYFNTNTPEESIEVLNSITLKNKRKQPLKIENLYTEAYKSLGNYEKALLHNQRLAFLQDSINKLDENVRIAEITAQYDTKKKENQILRLQEENEKAASLLYFQKKKGSIISLIAISFLFLSVWFIKRWKKSSKKARLASIETEVIKKKVEAQHLLLNNKSKVYLDELQFIKSDGNYVEFHSVEQRTMDRNKLKSILSKLPPNFVRVHRSYIVNKNKIASFTSNAVFLKSGAEIPLSRTFKSNL